MSQKENKKQSDIENIETGLGLLNTLSPSLSHTQLFYRYTHRLSDMCLCMLLSILDLEEDFILPQNIDLLSVAERKVSLGCVGNKNNIIQ